ncbi:MAG: chorismate synthase [Lachnospiraceae bacterium]|nr:chorismate synthase [Lachnospiraceae bacterium]
MAAGSGFGKNFRVTTFGESHGKALGCVIDGCPAGLVLSEDDLIPYMSRRKPGQSEFTTARNEDDAPEIVSGIFEGKTTGTPIAIIIYNKDQRSKDYSDIADIYRPGHADYTFDKKFGIRDYRGGGRSSGRETAARVAAGAVAAKLLEHFNIKARAYTKSIGPVTINSYDANEINNLYMPDHEAYEKASDYIQSLMKKGDSAGGVIECVISGVPAGLGDPVFDKLDALLSHAVMSIGAVKGVEIGDGFNVSFTTGSQNNDAFIAGSDGNSIKASNHSGGILGGISDGSDIIFRCAIKPTPSISMPQKTVDKDGNQKEIVIKGRHDPVVVPRAVVVVEAMANIVVADAMLGHLGDKIDFMKEVFQNGSSKNSKESKDRS